MSKLSLSFWSMSGWTRKLLLWIDCCLLKLNVIHTVYACDICHWITLVGGPVMNFDKSHIVKLVYFLL